MTRFKVFGCSRKWSPCLSLQPLEINVISSAMKPIPVLLLVLVFVVVVPTAQCEYVFKIGFVSSFVFLMNQDSIQKKKKSGELEVALPFRVECSFKKFPVDLNQTLLAFW
jgi:hypothetical protein